MGQTLIELNQMGLSPVLIGVGLLIWRMERRITVIETRMEVV
ncbi:hypothetical protein [Grimontia sp. NTOU-MAR1]|nr:hypothetical protein [Grimontia sp. NTOU-MAR1]WRV98254.1 hypothetical protein VP504_02115 [Grimontia sp. NTOU-MAR1]